MAIVPGRRGETARDASHVLQPLNCTAHPEVGKRDDARALSGG